MKIRQIEAFKAVMESGSVTAASQVMLLTQPAVSKLISQLEWSTHLTLFIRAKGRLLPTPEAELLYAQVAQTFALVANLDTVVDEIKGLKRGQLVVSAAPMLCNSWLPIQCVRFASDRTDVRINLKTGSSTNVVESVAGGQADIGIGMIANHPHVHADMLAEIEAVCLMSPGHPLTAKDVVTHVDFDGQRFVHTGGLDGTRGKIEAMFTTFNVNVDVRLETIAASTTCNFIAAGAGLTLVNALTALEFRHLGYDVRRFVPRLGFRVYLLLPRHRPVSLLAAAFRDQLKTSAAADLLDIGDRLLGSS